MSSFFTFFASPKKNSDDKDDDDATETDQQNGVVEESGMQLHDPPANNTNNNDGSEEEPTQKDDAMINVLAIDDAPARRRGGSAASLFPTNKNVAAVSDIATSTSAAEIRKQASSSCLTMKKQERSIIFLSLCLCFASWLFFHRVSLVSSAESPSHTNTPPSSSPFSSLRNLRLSKMSASKAPRVLNVHVVPHTHDDVGWLKTVEQYYYGHNNSIQRASVRDILTSTVEALRNNPSRTFVYAEIKFFSMWWAEQGDTMRDVVRFLIANQQLDFVNGGWCMHDEAATHYVGMVDQTTTGHAWLKRELGIDPPRVAWQLDPFGHSATQASLLTSRSGFDALYFGRIDYQDLAKRQLEKDCEGLWQATAHSMNDTSIFWGLTGSFGGNYGPPHGFCFDILCRDEPFTGANRSRLIERTTQFLREVGVQADKTAGNHVMLTMGEDFTYQEAHVYFTNLDLLISTVMNYQDWGLLNIRDLLGPNFDRVNIFYSTPAYYTTCKFEEAAAHKIFPSNTTASSGPTSVSDRLPGQWSVKLDDFFPYADCPHCYWTGYYTSRTSFKRFERVCSAFLQAARQVETLSFLTAAPHDGMEECEDDICHCHCRQPLWPLEDAMGVVQHHDAVSGTAKQHVSDNYSHRLHHGLVLAGQFMTYQLKKYMLESESNETATSHLNLVHCHQLNETHCPLVEQAEEDSILYVVVYNPLAMERTTVVRLPVSSPGSYEIKPVVKHDISTSDLHLHWSVVVQAIPVVVVFSEPAKTKYVLYFDTGKLAPMGATAFRITRLKPNATVVETEETISLMFLDNFSGGSNQQRRLKHNRCEDVDATNGIVTVRFDCNTGSIKRITNSEVSLDMEQVWGYYIPFDGKFDDSGDKRENSGAYIFRPHLPEQELISVQPAAGGASFINTSVGMEVHVTFQKPWIKQVVRIFKGQPWVEIEFTVGPVPIELGRGKEVVTKFISSIDNQAVFYTDSNGREFMRRIRNHRPTWALQVHEPLAGNYYPVNAAIYIQDDKASMAVLVDRSRGGASIVDGSLELMVQRRTIADDHRGVGEAMNETCGGVTPYPPYGTAQRVGEGVVISGTHRLMVGRGKSGARLARSAMDMTFAEPIVMVGWTPPDVNVSFRHPSFSIFADTIPVPPNVVLTTLMRLPNQEKTTLLLRLGHQYGVGEDLVLSKPVHVNLSLLLASHYKVEKVTEKTLTGTLDWEDYMQRRLNWTGIPSTSGGQPDGKDPQDTTIMLKPLEIRTFEIEVSVKHSSV